MFMAPKDSKSEGTRQNPVRPDCDFLRLDPEGGVPAAWLLGLLEAGIFVRPPPVLHFLTLLFHERGIYFAKCNNVVRFFYEDFD